MLSLLALAPLLHYTANSLLVSAPILVNDKFNKIYPAMNLSKAVAFNPATEKIILYLLENTGSVLSWGLPGN